MLPRFLARPDPMIVLLLVAVALASLFPAAGDAREGAQAVSNAAIFVLFLLNGMRLARSDVRAGIGNWRYLVALFLWCYGAMAVAGFALSEAQLGFLPGAVALGFLFVGTLPSTVQSATAYSSLAGGNVATSVVSAAFLNILGVFLTAPLFSLLGGGDTLELGLDGLIKIGLILILPFGLGQLVQIRARPWVERNRHLVSWMDRAAIAIAVYVAFSSAVEQGLWDTLDGSAWLALLAGIAAFLLFAFGGAWLVAGLLKLSRGDRIAFFFAGAHKSTAMGAPLAMVLFPPATAGLLMVPLLVYHLLQLTLSAPIATRLSARLP